ncbi:MAG TPA: diguanylate cyclase [Fibrobacteraceae bacterium]|nr:diguanylate cyclase [Fibrobacteraceae bacterium]
MRWIYWNCVLIGTLFGWGQAASPQDTFRLQLNWQHQFRFAGYYAALEKGYYHQAGFEVRIQEASPGENPAEDLVQGRAEFGVSDSRLLLDRDAGLPVVVLAVIFQHSPDIILARQDANIQNIHDLEGKSVMFEDAMGDVAAYLLRERVEMTSLQRQTYSDGVKEILSGKVVAISARLTDEPYALRQAKIPYSVFSPASAGIDFYGDNLFTTESMIRRHPSQVKAFRSASLKGWEYALAHPQEIIRLILFKYGNRHDSTHLAFEANATQPMVAPPLVPIGYMFCGRWQHISEVYGEVGLLHPGFNLEGFLYTNPDSQTKTTPSLVLLLVLLLGLLLLLLALVKIHRLRRQIQERITMEASLEKARQESEVSRQELIRTLRELERWATTDKLTELANRRQLEQRGESETARSSRYGTPLSLLLLDLDFFKQINDREGHHMGDQVLIEVAKVLRRHVRAMDIPGRWGGEEFLVLLPNTAGEQALQVAEKLRKAIAEHRYPSVNPVSASIGVANLQAGESLEALLGRADSALYDAKEGGRNQVKFA